MLKLIVGAAAGAAAVWFLDPDNGARRRNQARDQAMTYARRQTKDAAARASRAADQVKGSVREASPVGGRPAAEERLGDPGLQAKIESEAFREAGVASGQVSVNVEDGIAYLRGELSDRTEIDGLVEAVRNVEGVRDVQNLLHTPGEAAPTKESEQVAGEGSSG
jgi:osmotically-inducible protein OsmY